jgi:hypothetical protein
MSRINEKLGLKPATRKRAIARDARHPEITRLRCVDPACNDSWILENVIHGKVQRNCARCGKRQPMPGEAGSV